MIIRVLFCFALCLSLIPLQAQPKGIKVLVSNDVTPVKDQGYSGTCWSFATISFLESELIRMGKPATDLSEWFIVRHIYPEKVRNFLRTQGHTFLTAGGQCQDVLWVLENWGLVPDSVYGGPMSGWGYFNSSELDTAVVDFARSVRVHTDSSFSPAWEDSLSRILDKELGPPPANFDYDGKSITPRAYAGKVLGLNKKDYVQFTSYNHHPFYTDFCLESRYNWSYSLYTNLPLDEFMEVLDAALQQGYTVALNCDVSEASFDFDNGTATVAITDAGQDSRQLAFETGRTTVDHIMHITGIAEDSKKQKYYVTKNSWGEYNSCKGYMYLSEDYIRQKAVSILVHREAVPEQIREKLDWK